MCGRYFIDEGQMAEEIMQIVEQINRRQPPEAAQMKLGEIYPSDVAPAVCAQGARPMRWGFARADGKGLIINARSETAAQRPMFAREMRAQRLVVPASGYYEWLKDEQGKKQKYAFSREDEPLYMAGLWRMEPGHALPAFVILTTDAAPAIRFVHERMPVLLGRRHLRAWLRDDQAAQQILHELELQVRFGMV